MDERAPQISVIISTQNRADSLSATLDLLAAANRENIRAEVIVVDNAGQDNTKDVVAAFSQKMPARYLYEPTLGVFGKSHALNRALRAGGLGEIIAVLDDDMSPRADWFQGVMAICKRWPDKDIFTGRCFIIWPHDDVPGWAKDNKLHSSIFSAADYGESDRPLEDGRWFSGNHFWFRSRVLEKKPRFNDLWLTEPDFMLDLAEMGCGAMAGPDAVIGHRVQTGLLVEKDVLARAIKTGLWGARVRLQPYREKVKQARLFHEHPLVARLFCGANSLRWLVLYFVSYLLPGHDNRIRRRIAALERLTTYRELLRVADQHVEYSVWRRRRSLESAA